MFVRYFLRKCSVLHGYLKLRYHRVRSMPCKAGTELSVNVNGGKFYTYLIFYYGYIYRNSQIKIFWVVWNAAHDRLFHPFDQVGPGAIFPFTARSPKWSPSLRPKHLMLAFVIPYECYITLPITISRNTDMKSLFTTPSSGFFCFLAVH